MGAGLLAIPFTFWNVGIVLGSVSITVFAAYNYYAIWMLVYAGKQTNVRKHVFFHIFLSNNSKFPLKLMLFLLAMRILLRRRSLLVDAS